MGWEKRGNGLYYYRKHRCGKKVYSEYVGTGPGVEAVALLAQQQRETASYRKQLEQKEQQRERKLRRDVDESCAFIRVLGGGYFLTNNYHAHHGQWRKSRSCVWLH